MNDTMTRELADAARRCDTSATKVVVLTGSGRFFCAGGDLKSFASAPHRGQKLAPGRTDTPHTGQTLETGGEGGALLRP